MGEGGVFVQAGKSRCDSCGGDKDRFRLAKYSFGKEIKEAKRQYSKKLEHQFAANQIPPLYGRP